MEVNFSIRRVATTGHEILNPDGEAIGWTMTKHWALLIAALLNQVEADGLSRLPCAASRAAREAEVQVDIGTV